MINSCKSCYGRGFLFARYAPGWDPPGEWEQAVCSDCNGKKEERAERDYWYHKGPQIDAAIAWLKIAPPPNQPFRLFHGIIENVSEYWADLQAADPRFRQREIMRVYDLYGGEDF